MSDLVLTALCPVNFVGIFNNGDDETWVPIEDMRNDWVQIGSENSCVRFSGEYPNPPAWGEVRLAILVSHSQPE